MLVCVKTLVEAKSFEEVRNSKEWLTTSETWQYFAEHSLYAACYVGNLCYSSMNSEVKRMQKTFSDAGFTATLYLHKWVRVPYASIYERVPHVTFKDNAGNNVKFYNIGTIREIIEHKEKEFAEEKRQKYLKMCANVRANCGRSAAANKTSKYSEKINFPEVSLIHGSFYDPQWF